MDVQEREICVPMVDGRFEAMEQLPLSSAIKTLGSMTCPSGSSASALSRMQQQGQEWIDRDQREGGKKKRVAYDGLSILAKRGIRHRK